MQQSDLEKTNVRELNQVASHKNIDPREDFLNQIKTKVSFSQLVHFPAFVG